MRGADSSALLQVVMWMGMALATMGPGGGKLFGGPLPGDGVGGSSSAVVAARVANGPMRPAVSSSGIGCALTSEGSSSAHQVKRTVAPGW